MMSFKEAQAMGRRIKEEEKRIFEIRNNIRNEELRKMGVSHTAQKMVKPKYDHPSTPDDGFVTVLYIVGMVASLMFKEFWIPWILLTVGYTKFITRHDND